MLFGHVQFRFEDDPKPVCQKYSHAKIYLPKFFYFYAEYKYLVNAVQNKNEWVST